MTDKTIRMTPAQYQEYLKDGQVPGEAKQPKPSKYGNHKVEWGGMTFDSKWELERYLELIAMETAGEITELKRQVTFVLQPAFESNGEHVRAIKYIADFAYNEIIKVPAFTDDGVPRPAIEDAKGFQTDIFRLKWKLLQYLHRDTMTRFILSRKGEKTHG